MDKHTAGRVRAAFAAVVDDDLEQARDIVLALSGQDRAVLSFWLTELSSLVDDTEMARRSVTGRRTRDIARGEPDTALGRMGQDTGRLPGGRVDELPSVLELEGLGVPDIGQDNG